MLVSAQKLQAAAGLGWGFLDLVQFALRRPYTVLVVILGMALGAFLGLRNMSEDVFPPLGVPTIYVAQPYGGMDPAQMEGFLTYYYEYHFLYITGIEHVESKSIQGAALIKLQFYPGTDMSQAMSETVSYVNRARAFMPPGTVPPFVTRFDAGSVPVGYLAFSSATRKVGQIQDLALNTVRPLFATLEGVSAPPPFGGSPRTIVVDVDPAKLQSHGLSAQDVVTAIANAETIAPSGNINLDGKYPIVPVNSIVTDVQSLARACRSAPAPSRPSSCAMSRSVSDASDVPTSIATVNGKPTVYIPVTKRADASTISVVNLVKQNLPKFQAALPDDTRSATCSTSRPSSPRAITQPDHRRHPGRAAVRRHGAAVPARLAQRPDRRREYSALVAGGGVRAVDDRPDHQYHDPGRARAGGRHPGGYVHRRHREHPYPSDPDVRAWSGRCSIPGREVAVPLLIAMLCVVAVFLPSFAMVGAARALFVPLSLAVGFSMVASYLLANTLVPILSVWVFRSRHEALDAGHWDPGFFERVQAGLSAGRWTGCCRAVGWLRWIYLRLLRGRSGR